MTTELVELADRPEFTVDEALRIADQNADSYEKVASVSRTLAAEVRRLRALASRAGVHPDTVRMDWLADRDNAIGNVQLPAVCVMNNLHDMRAAIDEAMRLDPEVAAAIAAAPEPVAVGSSNSTNDEESV